MTDDSHIPAKESAGPSSDNVEVNSSGRRALLLDPDLFFVVKVSAMLKHIGMETVVARTLADFERKLASDGASVVLVNTAAPGVEWQAAIRAAQMAQRPVIAYGSHVDLDAQAQARTAGATRVIVNSKLAADLPTIIEQTLQRTQ